VRSRMSRIAAVIGVGLAMAIGAPGQDGASERSATGVPDLRARLAALEPDDPLAYFRLAEEVAYEMQHGAGMELARRLFVLSFELDRRRDAPEGLGASVCYALAELSTDVDERRWLRAVGRSIEPETDAPRWSTRAAERTSDRAPLELAEALGAFRAGETRSVRAAMARMDGEAMLRDAGMEATTAERLIDDVERLSSAPRQTRSSDGRVIRSLSDGRQTVELDPTTGGNPGPSLTESEFIDHLRAELLLLGGSPASWGGQVILDGGRTLRDIDPEELAPYFGVDPAEAVWRAGEGDWMTGEWVAPEAAE